MTWLNQRLPSMSSLSALEAVARHGSITRAAQELGRTPSALSHQLRFLEEELGSALTMRKGKRIDLTLFGARYATEVRKAFTLLYSAASIAGDIGQQGRLTISSTTGFGTYWLCKNLYGFRSTFPHIILTLKVPPTLIDISDPDVDVFILHGRNGSWPNHSSELLAETHYVPVCSPSFLNQMGGRITVDDLRNIPLIHLNGTQDWALWCSSRGVELPLPETGIFFENIALSLTAAMSGLGVALGVEIFSRPALTEGKLVQVLEHKVKASDSYYIVTKYEKRDHPEVKLFIEWLKATFYANSHQD